MVGGCAKSALSSVVMESSIVHQVLSMSRLLRRKKSFTLSCEGILGDATRLVYDLRELLGAGISQAPGSSRNWPLIRLFYSHTYLPHS